MGLDVSANLVCGITLNNFFKRTWDKVEKFEEYDKKGNKTGKLIEEKYLMAILPNDEKIKIGEYFNNSLKLDFYDSLGFEGSENTEHDLELISGDYEINDINNIIIGITFSRTGSFRHNNLIKEIDEIKMEVFLSEVLEKLLRFLLMKT